MGLGFGVGEEGLMGNEEEGEKREENEKDCSDACGQNRNRVHDLCNGLPCL